MTEYSSNQPIGKEWTEKERRVPRTLTSTETCCPALPPTRVPFDRETRLRANGPSVAVIDARKRWPARRRSDHTNRGIARGLVTLLEGTQARMV